MTHLLRSAYLPLLALCLALTASGVAQARVEVDILSARDKTAVVRVVGQIQEGEDEQLKQELLTLQQAGYRLKLNAIVLDSPGGSGSTAEAMGRLIRHNKLNTYVAPKSRCASACVSVLRGVRPETARQEPHALQQLMDRHGTSILVGELIVLAIATVGSVAHDSRSGGR